MTIDDSTLIAQAVSSTSKRVRRFIFENVGQGSLRATYIVGSSLLWGYQWGTSKNGVRFQGDAGAIWTYATLPGMILLPEAITLLQFALSPQTHESPAKQRRAWSGLFRRASMESIVIATLIPLAAAGSPVEPWGKGMDYLNALFVSNSTILAAVGLREGLWNTVKGAWSLGFGTARRAAVSAVTLAACVPIFGGASLISTQTLALNGAATVLTFAWLYRLRNSLRPRAVGFTLAGAATALAVKTYLPSASSRVKLDTLIPVVFFRTYLSTIPPSPLPVEEAEKEKNKPDPQKALTPTQESEVDLVLEMGWYVALRVWRACM